MANAAESRKADPFLQESAHKIRNPILALNIAWTDYPTTKHGQKWEGISKKKIFLTEIITVGQ